MAIKKSSVRTRNWTFIVYPDSAPENWRALIDDLHLEWIESPLHDDDVNATGEAKKPHWHIVVLFSGVKTFEQVKEITDMLNAPIPQVVHSARGAVRYMAHLDNPEKAQYSISNIIAHGGADLTELLKPCSSERYTLIKEMIEFIKENKITEFKELVDFAVVEHFDDWFPLLSDNSTVFINSYIKSCRHSAIRSSLSDTDNNNIIKIDKATGEVIS